MSEKKQTPPARPEDEAILAETAISRKAPETLYESELARMGATRSRHNASNSATVAS